MTQFILDCKFNTEVERSERVLEIAEAFGLGLDDKTFVVFDNQPVEIKQGDVVYITGESGSGKSQALRLLKEQMIAQGKKVADLESVELLDVPLIDQLGTSINHAMSIFSKVGMNDANMYIRKPKELSDGQRYRFRMAKMIEQGAEVWFADEFMAILDRISACNIAFTIQKMARSVGATLIVATTHMDMVQDLAPSVYIEKRYREKIEVKYPEESK